MHEWGVHSSAHNKMVAQIPLYPHTPPVLSPQSPSGLTLWDGMCEGLELQGSRCFQGDQCGTGLCDGCARERQAVGLRGGSEGLRRLVRGAWSSLRGGWWWKALKQGRDLCGYEFEKPSGRVLADRLWSLLWVGNQP